MKINHLFFLKLFKFILPLFISVIYIQISFSQNSMKDTGCFVSAHRNVHKAIPDITNNDPLIDTIEFSGIASTQTFDAILTIDSITHTWIGDLVIALVKDSISDTVLSRIGRAGIGFGLSCDNLIGTGLSDTAIFPVQNMTCQTSGGNANSTGSFRPKYPLNIFRQSNVNPNGRWILKIYDWGGGDTGTLRAWTLKIKYCQEVGIVNEAKSEINNFTLYQNFPNPFNPVTLIKYEIPGESFITLDVFDITGRKIRNLVSEKQNRGKYEIYFNANSLPGGAYYYLLYSERILINSRKMILIK